MPIAGVKFVMKDATSRSVVRRIHIVFALPILGYIYGSFERLPDYAPATRFVFPCDGPFGIVDVERPRRSTTCFEKIGPVIVTFEYSHSSQNRA
jgi:hypothetical protein